MQSGPTNSGYYLTKNSYLSKNAARFTQRNGFYDSIPRRDRLGLRDLFLFCKCSSLLFCHER